MLDYIIVYIFTADNIVTNINFDSIKKYHNNIVKINHKDFNDIYYPFLGEEPISKWNKNQLWYSCDSIFLYWYLSNKYERAKNYILVEWDTYCHNTSIIDFIGKDIIDNNNGIISSTILFYKDNPNDYWYKRQNNMALLKKYFSDSEISKYSPMSCSVISDNCINDIIDYIQEYPEINSIYIENKFPTIAKKLGYSLTPFNNNLKNYISYHENICSSKIQQLYKDNLLDRGVFHPIKKINILDKFLLKQMNPNKKNIEIINATYGAYIDVTKEIGYLLSKNNKLDSNNNISGDPAPGVRKKLTINYKKNNQIYTKTVPENSSLNIDDL